MSKFDPRDPGCDADYCNALSPPPDDDAPPDDVGHIEGIADSIATDSASLVAELERLSRAIDARMAERQHIIDVLSAFYRAPLSIGAVAPVLALAEHLNPALKAE